MVRYDPFQVIPRISSYGIVPFLGMIVGFDHDTPAVFNEIEEFLDKTASPFASISILNAPDHTPLYERMKREGRLVEDFGGFWHLTTNIIPKQLTPQELFFGQKHLFKKLYEPEHFGRRMIGWLRNVKYFTDIYSTKKKNLFRIGLMIKIFYHFTWRVPASGESYVLECPERSLEDQSPPHFQGCFSACSILALLRLLPQRIRGGYREIIWTRICCLGPRGLLKRISNLSAGSR